MNEYILQSSVWIYLNTFSEFDYTCPRYSMDELPSSGIDADLIDQENEPIPLIEFAKKVQVLIKRSQNSQS